MVAIPPTPLKVFMITMQREAKSNSLLIKRPCLLSQDYAGNIRSHYNLFICTREAELIYKANINIMEFLLNSKSKSTPETSRSPK